MWFILKIHIGSLSFFTVLLACGQFGFKTAALRRRLEAELQDAEIRMWRFSLGATRIKNNNLIRGTEHVRR